MFISYPQNPRAIMTKTSKKEETSVETTLSQEGQAIAKEELREDQAAREDGLTQLRQWVKKNDRIQACRMGKFVVFLPTLVA